MSNFPLSNYCPKVSKFTKLKISNHIKIEVFLPNNWIRRSYVLVGSLTFPMRRTVPVSSSLKTNRKGSSQTNLTVWDADLNSVATAAPAAATSLPFSLTITLIFWKTWTEALQFKMCNYGDLNARISISSQSRGDSITRRGRGAKSLHWRHLPSFCPDWE